MCFSLILAIGVWGTLCFMPLVGAGSYSICVDLAVDAAYGKVFDSALWVSLIRAWKVAAAHCRPLCESYT